MTQPFLYVRVRSQTLPTAIVVQDIDRQTVQIGEPFASGNLESFENSLLGTARNRVVHWGNDLYCQLGSYIYKYDVAANTGIWEVFYDATSFAYQAAVTFKRPGFWTASRDGVPYLITGWPLASNANNTRFVLIDTSGNITTKDGATNNQIINGQATAYGPGVSWRNKLVYTKHNVSNPDIILYDLKDDTINLIDGFDIPLTEGFAVSNPVVIDDRVYVAMASNVGDIYLGKINGNTLTSLGTISSGVDDIAIRNLQFMNLIEVTGCLYLAYCADDGGVVEMMNALQIFIDKNTQTVSNVRSANATIPPEINKGGIYTNAANMAVFARIDNLSGSGVNPIYEFDVIKNSFITENDDRRLYRWDGDMNTPWTFIDAGLNSLEYSYIMDMEGTSESIWTASGTLNVSPPRLEVSGIYINAIFKIYGAGQSGVKAQLLVDKDGEFLRTIGTPALTSHGLINGNQVEGLNADGSTEYTVTWDAANDGVLPGESPKVAIRVFV